METISISPLFVGICNALVLGTGRFSAQQNSGSAAWMAENSRPHACPPTPCGGRPTPSPAYDHPRVIRNIECVPRQIAWRASLPGCPRLPKKIQFESEDCA